MKKGENEIALCVNFIPAKIAHHIIHTISDHVLLEIPRRTENSIKWSKYEYTVIFIFSVTSAFHAFIKVRNQQRLLYTLSGKATVIILRVISCLHLSDFKLFSITFSFKAIFPY